VQSFGFYGPCPDFHFTYCEECLKIQHLVCGSNQFIDPGLCQSGVLEKCHPVFSILEFCNFSFNGTGYYQNSTSLPLKYSFTLSTYLFPAIADFFINIADIYYWFHGKKKEIINIFFVFFLYFKSSCIFKFFKMLTIEIQNFSSMFSIFVTSFGSPSQAFNFFFN